ncbi:MAG TPA: DUF952 domain-containing protein [Anaerolineales bacterium]|nr:DUF952 domain-containing protein [Anaerolineales bacterium]
MSENILHITSRKAWQAAQRAGQYAPPSLTSEGFIHCSTRAQVLPVAEKFYRGQTGLILLVIDPTRLASALKWEPPFDGAPPPGVSGAAAFPHIHGPLNLEAVVQVLDFEPASDGQFVLPRGT